jgi:hypothetical protein
MKYTKHLGALALALVGPAAMATAAGAGTLPVAAPTTTTTTVGVSPSGSSELAAPSNDRTGRVLAELTSEGRTPAWFEAHAKGVPGLAGGSSSAGPHQSADSYSPGPWCVYDCIATGVAYEHGDGVKLVVETTVDATITLLVCRDDDGNVADCEYFDYTSSEGPVTEFEWVIDPLDPGTYWVTAVAADNTGSTHAFGEFTLT